MPSVVTFAQLPEEEAAFVAYLQQTGDIWARAVNDRARNPKYKPLPVAEFLDRFARKIVAYHEVSIYLAMRDDIHRPAIFEGDIDPMGSPFLMYDRGQFRSKTELATSNLCFYPGRFRRDGTWRPNPPAFMKWGRKVLAWVRRHTPESVPVYRANYKTRATVGVAAACKKGLKVD